MENKDFQDLLSKAKSGDPEAQFELGLCYYKGRTIKRNRKVAAKWWKLAADQGHAEAMTWLGIACILSTQNYEEAVQRWKLAADQGNTNAQLRLGRCYFRGNGVAQNKTEALRLWKLCAGQEPQAKIEIGKMYYEGDGVEQNYEEAVKWFGSSKYWMGKCYLHGYGVEQNIAKTIELWESVAEGSYSMCLELAHLYSEGIYMESNYQKAAYWWSQAASDDNGNPTNGVPEALYELGCYYYEGKGVEKDLQMAVKYFKWAIKSYGRHGDGKAYAEMAFREEPERVQQEVRKYYNAYRMVIKLGDKSVIRKLRFLAQNGEVEAKNILEEFGM